MASKYLVSGTVTYTAATRTIASATMSVAFAATDVGKPVVFLIDTTVYVGRVASYVSATSVILHPGASLPTGNGTILQLTLVDTGGAHTFQSYLDRIQAMIQDDVTKLSASEMIELLTAAVTDFGTDKPLWSSAKYLSTGASSYNLTTMLGSDFKHGVTAVRSVEYPSGENPPLVLKPTIWTVYDDGTAQDGSNLKLMFIGVTPSAGEYFTVVYNRSFVLPEVGAQTFPDTNENFSAICLLAAAYSCFALASAYALSTDSTITADSVNYGDKTSKFITLGKNYLARYNQLVFGAEKATVAPATVTLEMERRASDRTNFLFH